MIWIILDLNPVPYLQNKDREATEESWRRQHATNCARDGEE